MRQLTFIDAEQAARGRVTRRERFLAEMEQVVPWDRLEAVIEPTYPKDGKPGRRPYPLRAMLRCYLMQNWFGYSDPGMEDALYEIPSMRRFAGLSVESGIPDETTLLKFRRLLESHGLTEKLFAEVNQHLTQKNLLLRGGSMVDATLIAAPPSTKNRDSARDPEMHQTKKGNQWYFGMKAHVGVDDQSGLVHTVVATAANVADVTVAQKLVRADDERAWADAGYTGADKAEARAAEAQAESSAGLGEGGPKRDWMIAARRSKIAKMEDSPLKAMMQDVERMKASVRARVEHVFRVLKRQFGYVKVRYRGLAKNTAQLNTLFALVNLYQVRGRLMGMAG